MDIYSKRRRARRLNDPNYDVHKSEDDEDGVDPDDLDLDYSGVVQKGNDDREEQREKMKKSVGGGGGSDIDWEEVFNGDREDPDLGPLDYSSCFKDDDEQEREKDAAAIGEAVADALEQRGVVEKVDANEGDEDADADPRGVVAKDGETEADDADGVDDEDLELDYSGVFEKENADEDADTDSGASVEKAAERTVDLLADMQDDLRDLRDLRRRRSVRNIAMSYVADGGDPEDTMDEVVEWVDDHSEKSLTIEEDGSVTVEEPA